MKYKPGDKVRIVKQWNDDRQNSEGKMDHWLGKTMTVRSCERNFYTMMEDRGERLKRAGGWCWYESMIDGYASLEDVREGTEIEVEKLL